MKTFEGSEITAVSELSKEVSPATGTGAVCMYVCMYVYISDMHTLMNGLYYMYECMYVCILFVCMYECA